VESDVAHDEEEDGLLSHEDEAGDACVVAGAFGFV
jgi:hypothetical protein